MPKFSIKPLSAVPDALAACIGWAAREWGDDSGFSEADWREEFARVQRDPVDEIFVAMAGDLPVGMAWMLEQEEIESHTHLRPWLSALVVDSAHRDTGVAGALMRHVEQYAHLGGDDRLFLLTDAPGIYFTHGWQVHDTTHVYDRPVYVMEKSVAA